MVWTRRMLFEKGWLGACVVVSVFIAGIKKGAG